jgi:hypothetical protein
MLDDVDQLVGVAVVEEHLARLQGDGLRWA